MSSINLSVCLDNKPNNKQTQKHTEELVLFFSRQSKRYLWNCLLRNINTIHDHCRLNTLQFNIFIAYWGYTWKCWCDVHHHFLYSKTYQRQTILATPSPAGKFDCKSITGVLSRWNCYWLFNLPPPAIYKTCNSSMRGSNVILFYAAKRILNFCNNHSIWEYSGPSTILNYIAKNCNIRNV